MLSGSGVRGLGFTPPPIAQREGLTGQGERRLWVETGLSLTGGEQTSKVPVFDMPSAQTLRMLSLVAVGVMCAAGGPSSSENGQRAEAEASLRASLQNYVSNRWGRPDGDTNYTAKFVDLNGDGRSEAVVLVSGQYWCGTGGCPLWVLTPRNSSWSMVTQAPIVRAPIRLLPSRSRGWSDLSAMLRFDGTRPL